MYINLNPRYVFNALLVLIILLIFANIFSITTKLNYFLDYNNQDYVRVLSNLFDFNIEKNIPTMFSAFILLFSAGLLGLLGIKDKMNGTKYSPWFGLSAVFVFLSVDEMMELHEHLITVVKMFIPTSGILYYAWIIPYTIGVIILLLIYYKFLFRLPRKILYLIILSGFIFIFGAIIIESFGGWEHELHGDRTLIYCSLYTVEETLEMLGVSLFIYTILSYSSFSIKIESNTNI